MDLQTKQSPLAPRPSGAQKWQGSIVVSLHQVVFWDSGQNAQGKKCESIWGYSLWGPAPGSPSGFIRPCSWEAACFSLWKVQPWEYMIIIIIIISIKLLLHENPIMMSDVEILHWQFGISEAHIKITSVRICVSIILIKGQ